MIDTDQYQDTIAVQRTCRRCQRQVRNLLEDGECVDDCSRPTVNQERQREAIRRGERAAAEYLTREGHPEEALKFKVAR